ncbi:MAG: hydantoinase/oxoprolinase family protein [Deltaproteobacteria bacterium]|nr:MAG: hydantoinase/oxoprolinase family protein [Deltaproteobacteria bacterium]
MNADWIVGTDIGGTFTDCVVMTGGGDWTIAKAPSTPPQFEEGLTSALAAAAEKLGIRLEDLLQRSARLAHGTTVATNALINERGARVGLITTKGFEETLWQMRGAAYCQGLPMEAWYNKVSNRRPFELVPRRQVAGVSERVDRAGRILCPLSEVETRAALRRLVEQERIEALAVGFLWSFANPENERRVRTIAAEVYPSLPVTLSSEIAPIAGEYERLSTTVLSAYLRGEVERYLSRMLERLRASRSDLPVFLMQADGGVAAPERAAAESVRLLQSGPVGGVVAGLAVAESLGLDHVLTCDMGGTSFDVCLLDGAAPYTQRSTHNRHVVATRMVDIESIGAGGGSIARVRGDHLLVGPDSAGARPGPVCYSRGGTEPTVTDANVVLGYLNPRAILGGRMAIDAGAAQRAIEERIARPLGLSVEEAALAIIRIVNAHMADLIRFHTLRRGKDPRDYHIVCFGGATPMHAAGIADQAAVAGVVIPLAGAATVLSALGIARADRSWTFSLGCTLDLTEQAHEALGNAFARLEAEAAEHIEREGVDPADLVWARSASVRYRLQTNELEVPVPGGRLTATRVARLARRFDRLYTRTYGKAAGFREAGRELVTIHASAVAAGFRDPLPRRPLAPADPSYARIGSRHCYYAGRGFVETAVYDGDRLNAGNAVAGPAVLETEGTTVLVPPLWVARYDEHRHILLERER